jgi:signal transduction histidine kinase
MNDMFNLICADSTANLFGIIDTSLAPSLLYYAYIPIVLLSLLIGTFVFLSKSSFHLPNKLLFFLSIVFSLYTINEILLWILTPVALVNFGWSLIVLCLFLITLLVTYFTYAFIWQRDFYFGIKIVIIFLSLPILILLPTTLHIEYFDIINCESVTGPLFIYLHIIMFLASIFIASTSIYSYLKKHNANAAVALGTVPMILILLFSDFIGGVTGDFAINLIEPVGMLLLISTLAYLIVRYKAFNIKLVGAQALVIGLLALVGSLLFVAKSDTTRIVAGATLIFTAITGYFLVRSVKKEVKQREELEVLTKKLAAANDRLKELDKLKSEFVSIASHQMRSPLTSMRGYASMVLDGSYGSIPDKAKEAIQRIADSSAFMAKMIENYLNVSRIESGNMKYELSDFNLKLETEKVVDDKRQEAMKKGLLLTFKSSLEGQGIVHADIGKTLEIIHNLLNNALKYTPKGSIDVLVHDDPKTKKIYVDIHDSGIGMNLEDVTKLFGKFERAQNANSVNITGTGLGLYVARTMALAMQGEITAMSEGQGKGSTFRFELTEVM